MLTFHRLLPQICWCSKLHRLGLLHGFLFLLLHVFPVLGEMVDRICIRQDMVLCGRVSALCFHCLVINQWHSGVSLMKYESLVALAEKEYQGHDNQDCATFRNRPPLQATESYHWVSRYERIRLQEINMLLERHYPSTPNLRLAQY
jgi:hypothetical protein